MHKKEKFGVKKLICDLPSFSKRKDTLYINVFRGLTYGSEAQSMRSSATQTLGALSKGEGENNVRRDIL